jgi:hypothetical protein
MTNNLKNIDLSRENHSGGQISICPVEEIKRREMTLWEVWVRKKVMRIYQPSWSVLVRVGASSGLCKLRKLPPLWMRLSCPTPFHGLLETTDSRGEGATGLFQHRFSSPPACPVSRSLRFFIVTRHFSDLLRS